MMSLMDVLRGRVCQFGLPPDYPLGDFINWSNEQNLELTELLGGLDELQTVLQLEADALQRHSNANRTTRLEQQTNWCLYCERIRAHLRALLSESKHVNETGTQSTTQRAEPSRARHRKARHSDHRQHTGESPFLQFEKPEKRILM